MANDRKQSITPLEMIKNIEIDVNNGASYMEIKKKYLITTKKSYCNGDNDDNSVMYLKFHDDNTEYVPTILRSCTHGNCINIEIKEKQFLRCNKCHTVYCSNECLQNDDNHKFYCLKYKN